MSVEVHSIKDGSHGIGPLSADFKFVY